MRTEFILEKIIYFYKVIVIFEMSMGVSIGMNM